MALRTVPWLTVSDASLAFESCISTNTYKPCHAMPLPVQTPLPWLPGDIASKDRFQSLSAPQRTPGSWRPLCAEPPGNHFSVLAIIFQVFGKYVLWLGQGLSKVQCSTIFNILLCCLNRPRTLSIRGFYLGSARFS